MSPEVREALEQTFGEEFPFTLSVAEMIDAVPTRESAYYADELGDAAYRIVSKVVLKLSDELNLEPEVITAALGDAID
jgi:hypothetical protein